MNVEDDEAGKLRAFRERFGRGWDADAPEYNVRHLFDEPDILDCMRDNVVLMHIT